MNILEAVILGRQSLGKDRSIDQACDNSDRNPPPHLGSTGGIGIAQCIGLRDILCRPHNLKQGVNSLSQFWTSLKKVHRPRVVIHPKYAELARTEILSMIFRYPVV